jgi:hypothetical protein
MQADVAVQADGQVSGQKATATYRRASHVDARTGTQLGSTGLRRARVGKRPPWPAREKGLPLP